MFLNVNELLSQSSMTKYMLSKASNVPYTTINDICSGKTNIEKCSAETLYKLSKVLGVSMERLVEDTIKSIKSF